MKLGLLLLVVAIILGGLIGTLVVRDPGYILVSYADMALETSLWFGLLLLLMLYVSIRSVVFVFSRSISSTTRFGSWLHQRRDNNARQQTVQGLLLMAEGQWAEARKVLVASADQVRTPLINFLSAARAAHEMGDPAGRDELLRRAHESTPGSRFAVALTQAELQMDAGQWEQCLATLLQLQAQSPRHPQVLAMLCRSYQQLEDWQALIEVLPEAKKRKVFTDTEFEELQLLAWRRRMGHSGSRVQEVWPSVPKELKRSSELVAAYAEALIRADSQNEAEAVLRSVLQRNWNDDLVDLYGQVVGADAESQLIAAESWLKERPNDPKLLLALGRICLMNQQWAKAREYLETSLRLLRTAEVYGELGRLCVALGDSERGAEYLTQSTVALPELPLPKPGS